MFGVKTGSHAIYVVMELCHFSLDQQPPDFRAFLHGRGGDNSATTNSNTGCSTGGGGTNGNGHAGGHVGGGEAVGVGVGAMVLNALVQDLLRGVSFLHSKGVAHCDLKPANVLVSFNRGGGRARNNLQKRRHYNLAQLKITDFGVSRVLQQHRDTRAMSNISNMSTTMTTMATTTATVSFKASKEMIAGSEAFMCPELLRLLGAVRRGELHNEVTADLLLATDAFACGCVVAFLCGRAPSGSTSSASSIRSTGSKGSAASESSDGGRSSSSSSSSTSSISSTSEEGTVLSSRRLASLLHPFYSPVFRSLTDNILAGRRRPLQELDIHDPRHLELVQRLTALRPAVRWTVSEAAVQSAVFEAAPTTEDAAAALMDAIDLRLHQPDGSCEAELLAPQLVRVCKHIPDTIGDINKVVLQLMTGQSPVPTKLDEDSCVLIGTP